MLKRGRPSGIPKTGGRQKGTPNKATVEVKEMARKHSKHAIKELARIAFKAESDAARIAAIKELLDRGHGRVPQAIVGSEDGPPIEAIHRVERVIVNVVDPRDEQPAGSSGHQRSE